MAYGAAQDMETQEDVVAGRDCWEKHAGAIWWSFTVHDARSIPIDVSTACHLAVAEMGLSCGWQHWGRRCTSSYYDGVATALFQCGHAPIAHKEMFNANHRATLRGSRRPRRHAVVAVCSSRWTGWTGRSRTLSALFSPSSSCLLR